MQASAPEIVFGSSEGGLYLGFGGWATHRVCQTADRLVADYLAAHRDQPKVVLDLSDCGWVDSTFAGWLLGLRKRLGPHPDRGLLLSGCSDRCRDSLDKMHLGAMFEYVDVARPEEVGVVACEGSDTPDKETLELMAQAHQQLASLDGENQAVFGPIADMLQRQLRAAK